jgi:hypothetical protein
MEKKVKPNNKEFVVLSVEGYKRLAGIKQDGENLYWTTDQNTEIPIKYKMKDNRVVFRPILV